MATHLTQATDKDKPASIMSPSRFKSSITEGTATSDDYLIEIHTQWMDENGLPLPDHLKDRGYTGRLVKVASNAANPGRHLQVIKFKEGEAGKYHYYLQVNGKSGADENEWWSSCRL
ncbi:MAG: hypothetical protein ACI843_001117 [Psychrobacter glaciei]|jgi:hypothetical protein